MCSTIFSGFRITSGTRHHIFKPVSVQAMWSAFQALHLATKKSVKNNYFEGGSSHSWISYYQERIKSKSFYLHEWHTITDASETTNNLYEYTNKYVKHCCLRSVAYLHFSSYAQTC